MPNASSITIKKFDEQYTDMVLKIMETFSDFFSPETINFAKEKLPKLQGFLAFEENMLLWFIVYEHLSTTHAKLYRMGVERTRQHQGIGSQLLWYAEDVLREQKILTLELLTLDEHPEYPRYAFTRQFYHKYGFETIESFNDEDVVILKMQKPLQRKSDTSTSFDNVVHDGELVWAWKMKVKKVSINELEKLAPLYGKITPALTSERREKIEDRIIDIFVIEEHNEFLAEITVVYEYTTHANFTIPNQRIYFEALRVHPKHQNKGLAQMLMKKVIENLYYVWYTEFTIGVEKNNTPALHIYQKLWFTIPLWEFFGDTYDTSPYTLYLKN